MACYHFPGLGEPSGNWVRSSLVSNPWLGVLAANVQPSLSLAPVFAHTDGVIAFSPKSGGLVELT